MVLVLELNPDPSISIDDVEIVLRRAFAIDDARRAAKHIQSACNKLVKNREDGATKVSLAQVSQSVDGLVSVDALQLTMQGHARHLALQESSYNEKLNRRERLLLPNGASTEMVDALEQMLNLLEDVFSRCNSDDPTLSPILRLFAEPESSAVNTLNYQGFPSEDVVRTLFAHRPSFWGRRDKYQHPLVIKKVRQVLDLGVGLELAFGMMIPLVGRAVVALSISCNRERTYSVFYEGRRVSSFSYDEILRMDSMG